MARCQARKRRKKKKAKKAKLKGVIIDDSLNAQGKGSPYLFESSNRDPEPGASEQEPVPVEMIHLHMDVDPFAKPDEHDTNTTLT